MLDVFGKIGDAVGGLVTGIFSGIDSIHTSDEEKLALKAQILTAEAQFRIEMAGISEKIVGHQASIIKAEAASKHTLAAIWRPILMLTFGFVIVYSVIAPSFGAPTVDLSGIPERFWSLMTVGIGGYVGGRTIEKVAPAIVEGMKLKQG
jgi:hypothetical protein